MQRSETESSTPVTGIHHAKVRITTLTPVHIGTGEKLKKGLDIVESNNQQYFIDWKQLIGYMNERDIKQASSELEKGKLSDQFIRHIIANYRHSGAIRPVSGKIYGTDIFPHIKLPLPNGRPYPPGSSPDGRPYLPGSSIKGTLRTILMWKLGKQVFDAWQKSQRRLQQDRGDRGRRNPYGYVRDVLRFISSNRIGPHPDDALVGKFEQALTRHLRIPDIVFESTEWWNAKVCGINRINRKRILQWKDRKNGGYTSHFSPDKFVTGVECIPIDAKAEDNWGVELGNKLWENWWEDYKQKQKEEDKIQVALFRKEWQRLFGGVKNACDFWRQVFRYCNEWMEEYLKREIDFFNKHFDEHESAEYIEDIWNPPDGYINDSLSKLKFLQEELHKCKQSDGNACLLRIGWGSGFHAMSGDWQYADHLEPLKHKGNVRMKTRKIAFREISVNGKPDFEFSLFGFIKVELV